MSKNKKDKESIFSARDSDWWNNACLNFMHGKNTWYGYSLGYKRAANLLTSYVDTQHHYQDTLVFPIIFLYRHYLELIFKQIIKDSFDILGKEPKIKSHSLTGLWHTAINSAEEALDEKLPHDERKFISHLVSEISTVDEKSDAFRYPIHADGSASLEGIRHINIMQFSEEIEKSSLIIEGVSAAVSNALAYVLERKCE